MQHNQFKKLHVSQPTLMNHRHGGKLSNKIHYPALTWDEDAGPSCTIHITMYAYILVI